MSESAPQLNIYHSPCDGHMSLKIAITGTPGVGKTTVADILEKRGYLVLDLNRLIHESSMDIEKDPNRDTHMVDLSEMLELYREAPEHDMVEGHLSHHLELPLTIVLRCSPDVLETRMQTKDWSVSKRSENLRSEILDVILVEAMELDTDVYEIDTSDMEPGEVAEAILEIFHGHIEPYEPGGLDWSEFTEDYMDT